MTFDESQGLVNEIFREVVAGRVCSGCSDVSVIPNQFGRVLIGFGVEEAVEPVEAPAERPAVEWPTRPESGGSDFGQCGVDSATVLPIRLPIVIGSNVATLGVQERSGLGVKWDWCEVSALGRG